MNERASHPVAVSSPRADLGEGPVWDGRLGLVYWTDITAGTIHAHDPGSGGNHAFPTGAEMVGCLFLTQTPGVLLVARESGLYRFDTRAGALDKLADPIPNRGTHRFNDGKCDATGRLWIGTMGKRGERAGALYQVDRSFTATEVAAPIMVPNGLAWTPDGATLYHIDTVERVVRAYAFAPEMPRLGRPRATLDLSAHSGLPDGMTIDRHGMLWIAFWEGGCVRRIDPASGHVLATIELPCRYVTSCTFGGPELRELYITTATGHLDADSMQREPLAGSLFRVSPDVAGFAEHLTAIS